MGERGAMGLQGPPGKDAEASELYRPLEFFNCSLLLDLIASSGPGADGITETTLDYSLLRYSNGDVEVSCASGLGSASSVSDSKHYPAPVMGAMTGFCLTIGTDYPQSVSDVIAGGWEYGLKPQPHATYGDVSGHWLNGRAFSFGENDCAAFIAGSSGAWQDAALSDVL